MRENGVNPLERIILACNLKVLMLHVEKLRLQTELTLSMKSSGCTHKEENEMAKMK